MRRLEIRIQSLSRASRRARAGQKVSCSKSCEPQSSNQTRAHTLVPHHQLPFYSPRMVDVITPSADGVQQSLDEVSTGLQCRNCGKPASTQTACPVCFT